MKYININEKMKKHNNYKHETLYIFINIIILVKIEVEYGQD